MDLLKWDIYELTSSTQSLVGVKMRGTLRKFSIERRFNLLAENASDKENCVRFAVLHAEPVENIRDFLKTTIVDIEIIKIESSVENPVLSKLKVNNASRY